MSTMQDIPSLLDLPEDVIYEILRFLDATSLYLLARTNGRLDEIIRSHITLWRRVDARRAPNDADKVAYCLDRCYDATHTLLMRGEKQSARLAPIFLPRLGKFSKLAILACENQIIDGTKYNVMTFPSQLIEFSLRHTIVTKSLEFFKGSGDHFQKLRVLVLDQCDWLNSSAFMPVSKYPSLEILSVLKCRNVENSIAYLTLSGQGFKNLKIFDARLSPLGNTLIRAIHRTQSLLAIYLQHEDLSYKVDYMRRHLQILQGAPTRDFLPTDDEFDISDLSEESTDGYHEDVGHCDDDGLIDYLSMQSEVKNTKFPQSVLYMDPYNSCTCGYDDHKPPTLHQNNLKDPPSDDDDSDSSDDDDDKSQIERLAKFIKKFSKSVHSTPSCDRGLRNSRPSSTAGLAVHYQFSDRSYNDAVRDYNEMEQLIADGGNDNRRSVIKLFIFPRRVSDSDSDDNSSEPPAKKMRTERSEEAGPSGSRRLSDTRDLEDLMRFIENDDDDDDSDDQKPAGEEMGGPRPPTPHPDVGVDNSVERSASYRIYFRDSPIVQIENINDTQRDIKVPLRRLSLRGYKKITNAALRYIGDLDLELLDVTYTGITSEGIRNYLISHPLCRVVHERFCTCLPNMHF